MTNVSTTKLQFKSRTNARMQAARRWVVMWKVSREYKNFVDIFLQVSFYTDLSTALINKLFGIQQT